MKKKKTILNMVVLRKKVFDYPKDTSLIEYLLKFVDKKDAIILDTFAGSGTTAHAVLNLNKKDRDNRKQVINSDIIWLAKMILQTIPTLYLLINSWVLLENCKEKH